MSTSGVSRRNFVSVLPLTVLATSRSLSSGCIGCGAEGPPQGPQVRQIPGFSGPFTQAEAAAVAASPMAREMAGLHGKGYPCSEMSLLAALRRFGLPENHLDAASVFGGGVGKRDLCGFLTGGLMAIGIASGAKYADRNQVHRVGRQASNAFWDWWITRGDLHCMGSGTTHETSEEFMRMSQRVAVKLEEVMLAI